MVLRDAACRIFSFTTLQGSDQSLLTHTPGAPDRHSSPLPPSARRLATSSGSVTLPTMHMQIVSLHCGDRKIRAASPWNQHLRCLSHKARFLSFKCGAVMSRKEIRRSAIRRQPFRTAHCSTTVSMRHRQPWARIKFHDCRYRWQCDVEARLIV